MGNNKGSIHVTSTVAVWTWLMASKSMEETMGLSSLVIKNGKLLKRYGGQVGDYLSGPRWQRDIQHPPREGGTRADG